MKLFAAIDLHSDDCGQVAANQSARYTAEFENIGRNVVVASKSGPVETGPTVLHGGYGPAKGLVGVSDLSTLWNI